MLSEIFKTMLSNAVPSSDHSQRFTAVQAHDMTVHPLSAMPDRSFQPLSTPASSTSNEDGSALSDESGSDPQQPYSENPSPESLASHEAEPILHGRTCDMSPSYPSRPSSRQAPPSHYSPVYFPWPSNTSDNGRDTVSISLISRPGQRTYRTTFRPPAC